VCVPVNLNFKLTRNFKLKTTSRVFFQMAAEMAALAAQIAKWEGIKMDRSEAVNFDFAHVVCDTETGQFKCIDNMVAGVRSRAPKTETAENVLERVQALARKLVTSAPKGFSCRPADIWVGVCREDALKDRWNQKYIVGMTHIAAVYKTTTSEYANDMEKQLMKKMAGNIGVANPRGRGGMTDAEKVSFVVYIAWRFTTNEGGGGGGGGR
jgi:hypothetical protein